MGVSNENNASAGAQRVKVARLIDQYALPDIGEELEELWTAEGSKRRSLRDLADYFNRQLLAQVMDEVGIQRLDGELGNLYRLLTADEVSNADQTRARRRLERNGIDVDSLLDDFVSYQAMRTYLKEYRGANYSASDPSPEERKEDLRRIQGRATRVTECIVNKLSEKDDFSLDEFQTSVEIKVLCSNCNTQYEVGSLLEQNGCDCGYSPNS